MTIVLSEEPMPTVHHLHRATVAQCPPCTQDHRCDQGDKCPAKSCAVEGGEHHDPAPTKRRPGLGLLIVALGWPVVLVVGCAVVVIVMNMPRISG